MLTAYTTRVRRIQIYIDDSVDEALTRRARRERRSKASLIRDAVERAYPVEQHDPLDEWAGGIDEVPGDIDEVVYQP
jgi:predicted transcriptional regulator